MEVVTADHSYPLPSDPKQPCSPLSSASEMLQMLDSLPNELRKFKAESGETALKAVKCCAPLKRFYPVLTEPSDSIEEQDLPKVSKTTVKVQLDFPPYLKDTAVNGNKVKSVVPVNKVRLQQSTNKRGRRLVNGPEFVSLDVQHKYTQTRVPLVGQTTQTFESEFPLSPTPNLITTLPVCSTQAAPPIALLKVSLTLPQPLRPSDASYICEAVKSLNGKQKPLGSTSSGNHNSDMESLKTENQALREEKAQLEKKLQECRDELMQFDTKVCTLLRREKELFENLEEKKDRLLWKGISRSDEDIKFYTGLPDAETFNWVLKLCTCNPIKYSSKFRITRMSESDQLLAVLMILKLNVRRHIIQTWFDVSCGTIINIEKTWIDLLHKELFMAYLMNPSDKRLEIPHFFPANMESSQIHGFVEVATSVRPNHNPQNIRILKGLLGVSTDGSIVRVSKLYKDSFSEREIIDDSGVLNLLNPGDQLLDRESLQASHSSCKIGTLDFHRSSHLTLKKGLSIVDKAFNRIKEYAVIERIPLSMANIATEVWQVCAALTCLRKPVPLTESKERPI